MCASPFGRFGVGHPNGLPVVRGPSVPWVSLLGPTGVPSDAQAGWASGAERQPLVVVLCWWWWTCDADLVHTRVLLAKMLSKLIAGSRKIEFGSTN